MACVKSLCPFLLITSMLHVEFKKWPCHPVEFKGQEPPQWPLVFVHGGVQYRGVFVSLPQLREAKHKTSH